MNLNHMICRDKESDFSVCSQNQHGVWAHRMFIIVNFPHFPRLKYCKTQKYINLFPNFSQKLKQRSGIQMIFFLIGFFKSEYSWQLASLGSSYSAWNSSGSTDGPRISLLERLWGDNLVRQKRCKTGEKLWSCIIIASTSFCFFGGFHYKWKFLVLQYVVIIKSLWLN